MLHGLTPVEAALEDASTTPPKLAVNLLVALFTHDELAHGNCTKANRADVKLLDQIKI